jgi:O-antigen/teichoic acid export membrane protein
MSSLFRAISLFVLADLQCREKSYLYAKLNLVYIISLNVAFVYLIYIGMSISSWYYSLLLGALLQMIFALHVLKKEYANLLKSNYKFDFIYIFNEYKKGLIFIPQAVGFWIKLGIDRLLLSVFASAYILGQYMFGYQLLFPIIILSAAINLYMTPLINKNIIAKNFEFILKRLNVFFVFIMFFFIIALIVSKYFILNFYFDKYYNAIKYLVPLGLSMFFQSSMLIFINVFYYIKKKSFVSYFIFSTSIVNFVIGYLAMKTCGVTGLLYTNVIINLSLFMFIFIKLKLTLKKISSFES